jgi:hypothetical protein
MIGDLIPWWTTGKRADDKTIGLGMSKKSEIAA